MSDVARLAGVSVPTVSRVLNSPDVVRAATREKVERAICELGYRPNLAARALVTTRTNLLGILHPGGTLFGPMSMSAAIQKTAREHGYSPVLAIHESDTENAELLDHLRAIGVDGIVLVAPTESLADLARRHASTVPVVSISPDEALSGDDVIASVMVDNTTGTRDIVRHVLDHGHRSIAFFAGPDQWYESTTRMDTWASELERAGLDSSLRYTVGWHVQPAYEMARKVLASPDRPTAVVAANDDVALGVMKAAHDMGLDVPHDLAVVGFDNIEFSPFFNPSLTTVRQPFLEAGSRAMENLLDMMKGAPPTTVSLPTELIVRRSCGCQA